MEFCIIKNYVTNRGDGPIPCRILAVKNSPSEELAPGTMAELETGTVKDGVFYQAANPCDWMVSAIPDAMQSFRDPHDGEAILHLTAWVRNSPELYKHRDLLGRVRFTTDERSVYLGGKYICDLIPEECGA